LWSLQSQIENLKFKCQSGSDARVAKLANAFLKQFLKSHVVQGTGDHDPGVLPVNGDSLHARLPRSKSDRVDAGHFAWADAADQYATLIIDWWNGRYERV
jgi:pimeloyl-ACP methyl ester carboxylesterase